MRLLDCRRLTGPNLLLPGPGAVLDMRFGEYEPELVIGACKTQLRRLIAELGWAHTEPVVRWCEGGASLAIPAPVDALYTATDLLETAWDAARDWLEGEQHHLLARAASVLREQRRGEERPRLMRLLDAAEQHGVPVLVDEERLTLGLGCRSSSYDLYELPHPDDLDWSVLGRVPVVLVTGTNGKTTTSRLLAAMARSAGISAGLSSTDGLSIAGESIARGDYAGPGGARQVLRDARCELAVLETARGGLLRRGLALTRAEVGLITNIASDHLGEFGISSLQDLADVKWSITRALGQGSTLVLNAEDPLLMQRAAGCDLNTVLFALDPRCAALVQHVAAGGIGYTVRRGVVQRCRAERREGVLALRDIPICFGGAARHNVANVLAAIAVAEALALDAAAIAAGLRGFAPNDNPGRANLYRVGGVTVLLDFAHNPAGLAALLPVAQSLPAQRRALVLGQAGDRSDEDIRDFAAAAGLQFDRIFIKRLDGLARGRAPGAVAALMRQAFRQRGYPASTISEQATELGAARAVLRWACPGDLVVFLSHEQREQTRAFFERKADTMESDAP